MNWSFKNHSHTVSEMMTEMKKMYPIVPQQHPARWLPAWTTTHSQMPMSRLQPLPRITRVMQRFLPLLEVGRWSWGTGGGENRPPWLACRMWTRPSLQGARASRWEGLAGCPKDVSGPRWSAACRRTAPWRGWSLSAILTHLKEAAGTS